MKKLRLSVATLTLLRRRDSGRMLGDGREVARRFRQYSQIARSSRP